MEIHITGIAPVIDGIYPLDLDTLTNRDFHTIKRLSGVRARELDEAFRAGDLDVYLALALIGLGRAGKQVPEDALLDAEVGKIVLEFPEADDADPPTPAARGKRSSASAASGDDSNAT